MALPKRKSRPITVAGKTYRWQFSDCYRAETNDHSISVVVQLENGDGAKIVGTGRCETRPFILEPAQIVRPNMVAAIINHALNSGWEPESSAGDFRVKNIETYFPD